MGDGAAGSAGSFCSRGARENHQEQKDSAPRHPPRGEGAAGPTAPGARCGDPALAPAHGQTQGRSSRGRTEPSGQRVPGPGSDGRQPPVLCRAEGSPDRLQPPGPCGAEDARAGSGPPGRSEPCPGRAFSRSPAGARPWTLSPPGEGPSRPSTMCSSRRGSAPPAAPGPVRPPPAAPLPFPRRPRPLRPRPGPARPPPPPRPSPPPPGSRE